MKVVVHQLKNCRWKVDGDGAKMSQKSHFQLLSFSLLNKGKVEEENICVDNLWLPLTMYICGDTKGI